MALRIWTLLMSVFCLCFSEHSARSDTWYVDSNQTAACLNQDGLSWSTAYKYLQDALLDEAITEGATIHVAQGTYHPDDTCANPDGGVRSDSFLLLQGVFLRGGYLGLSDPEDPDTQVNDPTLTILSGDLDGDDWIAVSYETEDSDGHPAGVDLFKHVSGEWSANLVTLDYPGPSNVNDSGFGLSLDIEGDLLVVGAGDDNGQMGDGAAYVFARVGDDWYHRATLKAGNATFADAFGVDVRISNERVMVGAPLFGTTHAGAAYLFVGMPCLNFAAEYELHSVYESSNGGFGSLVPIDEELGVVVESMGQADDVLQEIEITLP